MKEKKKHESEIIVNVGGESISFKISWADLFDKVFLEPLRKELKKQGDDNAS